jgi:hypothetical protein
MHMQSTGFQHSESMADDGVIEGEYSEVTPDTANPTHDRLDKPGSPDKGA